jgi:uncharacterized protein YegP (UPF0339 family)
VNSNVRAGSSPALSTRKLQTIVWSFFYWYNFQNLIPKMGTFVITKRQSGLYKFEFNSRRGKTIFIGADFELRFECEENAKWIQNQIESIFFMKIKSKNGKLYFKLILDEKEVALSRKYTTVLLMEKGINEIKRYIDKAEILDFSGSEFIFPDLE